MLLCFLQFFVLTIFVKKIHASHPNGTSDPQNISTNSFAKLSSVLPGISQPSFSIDPNLYNYQISKTNPVPDVLSSSPPSFQPFEYFNSIQPNMNCVSFPNTNMQSQMQHINVPVQPYTQNGFLSSILDPNFPIISPQICSTPFFPFQSSYNNSSPFSHHDSLIPPLHPTSQQVENPSGTVQYSPLTHHKTPDFFSRSDFPPSPRFYQSSDGAFSGPFSSYHQSYPSFLNSFSPYSTHDSLSISNISSPPLFPNTQPFLPNIHSSSNQY